MQLDPGQLLKTLYTNQPKWIYEGIYFLCGGISKGLNYKFLDHRQNVSIQCFLEQLACLNVALEKKLPLFR